MTMDITDRDIVSARRFAASPARVFAAFRDPAQLARWWGPAGFTNTFEVFEFRPGGAWRFVMHGPDGTNYPNESEFAEIVEPDRIVVRHICAPFFVLEIGLAADGEGTAMSWHMRFESAATLAALKPVIVPANEQNFDRLAAVLAADA